MDQIDSIKQNIQNIDTKIDNLHNEIVVLQRERAYLEFQLKFEKSAFYSTDWLPDEMKNLNIFFPKKYHIVRFSHYPYEEYIVEYNNTKFILCDRVDFDRIDEFKIYHQEKCYNDINIPLHLQIYYREPEKKFSIIHSRQHLRTLADSLANARQILAPWWHDEMAFGIALFYFWILTHYIGDTKKKYQRIHDVFGGRN